MAAPPSSATVETAAPEGGTDGPPEPAVGQNPPGDGPPSAAEEPSVEAARPPRAPRPLRPLTPRRIALAALLWIVASAVAVALVLYAVGPLLQKRDQRALLQDYRVEIRQAAGAESSFSEETEIVTTAPGTGDPVAILDIPDLQLQQVVVEGVDPQQTRQGPGHVPGTAGPGQPGNSAIVARRSAFGGSFGNLADLREGDRILVTTTQGPSVYEVRLVRTVDIRQGTGTVTETTTTTASTTTTTAAPPVDPAAPPETATTAAPTTTTLPSPDLGDEPVSTDTLYGPSDDDRLTLVTSASRWPLATDRATVVVAKLTERPFEPTPQNGRSLDQEGTSGGGGALAPLALALIAYLLTVGAAVVVYRRGRARSSYLLTAPPLVAATFLMAEALARLLPAWF